MLNNRYVTKTTNKLSNFEAQPTVNKSKPFFCHSQIPNKCFFIIRLDGVLLKPRKHLQQFNKEIPEIKIQHNIGRCSLKTK